MTVVVFRHASGNGLGSIERLFETQGVAYEYVDTPYADLKSFDPLAPSLLMVLGGSPGVYQADIYPFLGDIISILQKRLAADKPTIGICLGAQLMAAALGAQVYKGAQGLERGWFPVTVNEDGMKTPLRHLDGARTSMLHWHGDTFDLPDHVRLLARSAQYEHQAFMHGNHCIGLQCHPEVTVHHIEDWLVKSAGAAADGALDVKQMRADTARLAPALESATEAFMLEYLRGIGLIKAGAA